MRCGTGARRASRARDRRSVRLSRASAACSWEVPAIADLVPGAKARHQHGGARGRQRRLNAQRDQPEARQGIHGNLTPSREWQARCGAALADGSAGLSPGVPVRVPTCAGREPRATARHQRRSPPRTPPPRSKARGQGRQEGQGSASRPPQSIENESDLPRAAGPGGSGKQRFFATRRCSPSGREHRRRSKRSSGSSSFGPI